jgi:hypothetical protein
LPLFLRTEAFLFLKGGEPVEMDHPLTPEVRETVSRLMWEMQYGKTSLVGFDGHRRRWNIAGKAITEKEERVEWKIRKTG